jgi:hypothetical protein
VVRSVDLCSISGTDFTGFWNRFAGTCVVDVGSSAGISGGSAPRYVSNDISNRVVEVYGSPTVQFYEQNGGQEITIKTGATFPNKIGLAYAINDYQGCFAGVLGGVDTNTGGTIPNPNIFWMGSLNGNAARMTGHIRSVRYYKKRLANAKLQAITV